MNNPDSMINDIFDEVGLPELRIETQLEDVVSWIERDFWIPERKGMVEPGMKLEPYQKAVLREAHRTAPDGKYVYDTVLWSDIKKSAKSSIAAAVCLYRALNTHFGSCKIVANDLKQADSRVFYYIKTAILLNPKLQERCKVRNYKITIDNNAYIEAIPVDPSGEAGGNDDFIEFTELHAASSKASIRMWTEMTIPPNKHGYAQRWIDTYAGHSGESPILEQLYEEGVEKGTILDLGVPGLEAFASGALLVLWNTVPRLTWQTKEYYANEKKILTPEEYRRIHQNQWVTSTEIFVPEAWWKACIGVSPKLDKYREIVIALDGSVDDDTFGMIGIGREEDKIFPVSIDVWEPQNGHKLSYVNTLDVNDVTYPEGRLRWLLKNYNVLVVYYDPYQLHDMATRIIDEGIANMQSFNQGADRLIADKQLYDIIRDRRVVVDETLQNSEKLTQHILNANRLAQAGTKLRIVKRASSKKIDLAVTLSMASFGALDVLPE
jgi:hypothetical protein